MTLDDDVARLARTRPFSLMPREALQLLVFSSERMRLKTGDVLFEASDRADGGYFVLSGAIELRSAGGEATRTRRVEAGGLIGESALMAEIARPFAARALANALVLRAPREVFRRVLLEFPAAAVRIRQAYAARTRKLAADLDASRARALDSGAPRSEGRRAL